MRCLAPQESVAANDAPFVATSGRTQRVRGPRGSCEKAPGFHHVGPQDDLDVGQNGRPRGPQMLV